MYANWAKSEINNMTNRISQLQRFASQSREALESTIKDIERDNESKTKQLKNLQLDVKGMLDKQRVEHELIVYQLKKDATHMRQFFDLEETGRRQSYRDALEKVPKSLQRQYYIIVHNDNIGNIQEYEEKFLGRTLELEKILIKERMEAAGVAEQQLKDAMMLESSKFRLSCNNALQSHVNTTPFSKCYD